MSNSRVTILAINYVLAVILIYLVVASTWSLFFKTSVNCDVLYVPTQISTDQANELIDTVKSLLTEKFSETVELLQVIISIFGCAMTVLAIVFGFAFFSKLKEIENAFEMMKKAPELFVQRYHEIQLKELIELVHSQDGFVRSKAIRNIGRNPEIGLAQFDLLAAVLEKEFRFKDNAFLITNSYILIDVLSSLDVKRMFETVVTISESYWHDEYKMSALIETLTIVKGEENINRIKHLLEIPSEAARSLVFSIGRMGISGQELIEHAIIAGPMPLAQLIVSSYNTMFKRIEIHPLKALLERKKLEYEIMQYVYNVRLEFDPMFDDSALIIKYIKDNRNAANFDANMRHLMRIMKTKFGDLIMAAMERDVANEITEFDLRKFME